jgi:hypothetical protein
VAVTPDGLNDVDAKYFVTLYAVVPDVSVELTGTTQPLSDDFVPVHVKFTVRAVVLPDAKIPLPDPVPTYQL